MQSMPDTASAPHSQAEPLPAREQDIRTYLESLHRLRVRIQALRERESFFLQLSGSASLQIDPSMEDTVNQAKEHARALGRQADALMAREQVTERWIARLPNVRHRDILTLRYLNGWRYDRIAKSLDLSTGRVHALQREAMRLLTQYRAE